MRRKVLRSITCGLLVCLSLSLCGAVVRVTGQDPPEMTIILTK